MAAIPAYTPPRGLRAALDDFRDHLSQKYNVKLENYTDLHKFSVTRLNDFWMTAWDYLGVIASVRPVKAIDDDARIDEFPRFFQGAKLNFAENILGRNRTGTAIIDMREDNLKNPEKYTWTDLRKLVELYADALRSSRLKKGETVVLVGGNCVRSLSLQLATGALGGVFASFATDIGEKALDDRLQVLEPRFLFAETISSYNGKKIDINEKITNVFGKLKGGACELVLIGPSSQPGDGISFDTFLLRGTGARLEYEQVPFSSPFIVMFSSGTTGAPKGIVHSHGGLIMNGLKEHVLHHNVDSNDVHYHYSGIGWTLWNISLGSLLAGSTMVLYDGSPFFPSAEGLLRALFAQGVTSFGAGPRYFAELQKLNVKPKTFASSLRTIISTGALLPVPLAKWLVEAFGPVYQINMSGGTELCGSWVHATPTLPSYPGESSVIALGIDVAVFSPDGKEVPHGESGELVCRKPFPNMPTMFLRDPDRKRYFSSYFAVFPHVWTHGDFMRINPETKGIYILGRSDGVLNPSGIRFGSSEIYNILLTPRFTPYISDACVVGQQRNQAPYFDTTEKVVLFVKCTPSAKRSKDPLQLDPDLERKIRDQIAKDLSRRHVPTFIFRAAEIPYNVNGKKLEIQVRAILCGGEDAMAKLKVTEEEKRALASFLPFYDIEKVVQQTKGPTTSKL
ncbi:acetoacetate-CoA ligase [Rhinocladiella mackenziei CBS 650.93]|uniref:Acetoacetate-CoA ligase n=1 Tax=Rhinocladiella mackenziei CBS 650.93 TaxID=1442369 RepID=A0A0D2G5L6_9EURO|nr:acetoacetate-CoA ligase [Rhinocladiella mackenziei CBS 650.93]KIX10167.1 acetoacetate-CoA ligase [Rhinocladiella mackenziei CBS 650.93]